MNLKNKNDTVEVIAKKHMRRIRLSSLNIRIITITVGIILIIIIMLKALYNNINYYSNILKPFAIISKIDTIGYFVVYIIFILLTFFAFALVGAVWVAQLNKIITEELDPVKFTEVYLLLAKKAKNNRSFKTTTINIATGLFYQGDFAETYNLLSKVKFEKSNVRLQLPYCNLLANCCDLLGKNDELQSIYDAVKQINQEQRPNSAYRKRAIKVLRNIEMKFLWINKNFAEYEKMLENVFNEAKTVFEKVPVCYGKAKLDMQLSNFEAAKANLDYVIRNGNKLFYVTNAENLLKTIE